MKLKDVSFEVLDYEKLTEEQWEEFTQFHNESLKMYLHDVPEMSIESVKAQYKTTNPQTASFRIFAVSKDRSKFYSGGGLYRSTKKDPNYEINKHIGHVMGTVRTPYQRKKLASKTLKLLALEAKKSGLTAIRSGVFLESGKEFWKSFGAKIVDRDYTSELKVDEINYDMIEQWRVDGKKRAEGVTLEFYSRIPDDLLDEFLALHEEVHAIEADLEGHERDQKYAVSVESYNHRMAENKKTGWEVISVLSRESDGAISGFTEVYFNRTDQPGRVNQGMTGVCKKYQGRGLGKWVKAEMIAHLKEVYPDMAEIWTGNATVNAPMLSINRRMGFKTIRDGITFKIEVDELLKKLESIP